MYNIQNKRDISALWEKSVAFVKELRSKFSTISLRRLLTFYNLVIVLFVVFSTVCISLGVYAISDSLDAPAGSVDTAAENFENDTMAPIIPGTRVTVSYRGVDYYTFGTPDLTIGKLLASLDISMTDADTVNYSLDDLTVDGMVIKVEEHTQSEKTYTETIPYRTEIIPVATIPKGTRQVAQEGADGQKTVVTAYSYVDGELSGAKTVSETVTLEPITEVIYEGVGGSFVNEKGETVEYSHYIDVVATAYGGGGITRTGKEVKQGMIAVDPEVIPLGSKVYVIGDYGDYGVCYAEDTGGYIKGNRIDVYLEASVEVQLQFGRRDMRVYVIETPEN